MKHMLIGLGLLLMCVLLFMGGVHLFGRHIFNTKSCQLYNIDNIELRTGVDIPNITSTECTCEDNVKISKFIIDTELVDINRYINRNDLKLVNGL